MNRCEYCGEGSDFELCDAQNDGLGCTRAKGHAGEHVCCGTDNEHAILKWPRVNPSDGKWLAQGYNIVTLEEDGKKGQCIGQAARLGGIRDEEALINAKLMAGGKRSIELLQELIDTDNVICYCEDKCDCIHGEITEHLKSTL